MRLYGLKELEINHKLSQGNCYVRPPAFPLSFNSAPFKLHLSAMSAQILHIQPNLTLPLLPSFHHHTSRTLNSPISRLKFTRNSRIPVFLIHHCHPKLRPPLISCSAKSEDVGNAKNWEKWVPSNFLSAEKVFKWISEATSSPIAQYVASPTTFLHSVDPRIKWVNFLIIILPFQNQVCYKLL